mmetsp:Transcript_61925/g.177618  ORF Transcript_61925/g.177618 Transcript_61925/m.177618 type:complete len:296 (-) Transcript_61925:220-1107(-)
MGRQCGREAAMKLCLVASALVLFASSLCGRAFVPTASRAGSSSSSLPVVSLPAGMAPARALGVLAGAARGLPSIGCLAMLALLVGGRGVLCAAGSKSGKKSRNNRAVVICSAAPQRLSPVGLPDVKMAISEAVPLVERVPNMGFHEILGEPIISPSTPVEGFCSLFAQPSAEPSLVPLSSPSCSHRARFVGGRRRSRNSGKRTGSERAARRAMGAKLQAATFEVVPPVPASFDSSRQRLAIQGGLQFKGARSAAADREARMSTSTGSIACSESLTSFRLGKGASKGRVNHNNDTK